jgi:hypothetical protein
MGKKKQAAVVKPAAKKSAAAPDSPPRGFDESHDFVVHRADAKQHVNGNWLSRNWATVTATALRITSLVTGKQVFSRVADVTEGAAGAVQK